MDTANIEKAFESLLQELEDIKELNEVAMKHKKNTELLANKLQEYYRKSIEIDKIISYKNIKIFLYIVTILSIITTSGVIYLILK